MPDFEFSTDDGEEELPQPRRHSRRGLGIAILVVVVAVTLGVVLTRGHHGAQPTAQHSAASSAAPGPAVSLRVPDAPARSTAPVADIAASNVLVSTGVVAASGSLGSRTFTYDFDIVNDSATDLSITYPIRLVGPGGVVLPLVFAGIYDQSVAGRHIDDSRPPSHHLAKVGRGQGASLLIRVQIDCDIAAMAGRSSDDEPTIQVRLGGFTSPAEFRLADLASGYVDAVRQVCG